MEALLSDKSIDKKETNEFFQCQVNLNSSDYLETNCYNLVCICRLTGFSEPRKYRLSDE